jgi:hypothetical protein
MKNIKNAGNRAKQSWVYLSNNPVWSGVIVIAIVAAVPVIVHFAGRLTSAIPPAIPPSASSQPEIEEAAKIGGGSWGPSRILYRCSLRGNCIGADHVVFDSVVNSPAAGDERYFLKAKVLGGQEPAQSVVIVKPGDTLQVLAFIANDADTGSVRRKQLVARGTRFLLSLPTNSSRVLPLIGHIEAENAQPSGVYDTVFLRSSRRFMIRYELGSASFFSKYTDKEFRLSDNIVGDGALIGYRQPDGIFPACFCDSGWVSFRVRIAPPLHIAPPIEAAPPPETVYSVK